ncbi:hypothetical protein HDU80_011308 [Chytriomyces hyalinus]|nr:hypothetical protein HDU80_011308 [Chytriomyces hyalinus]
MTSTASALVRKLEEIVLAAEELVQNLSGPSAPFVEAVLHLKQGIDLRAQVQKLLTFVTEWSGPLANKTIII